MSQQPDQSPDTPTRWPRLRLARPGEEISLVTGAKYLGIGLIVVLVSFPFFWMVSTSLRPGEVMLQFPPALLPADPTVEPYFDALAAGQWGTWFLNTTIVSLGGTVAVLAIATPAAYALSRRDFPGESVLFLLFLSTMMVPPQVLLVPLFVFFARFDLVNSYPALIFSYMILFAGFTIFLLNGFFKTLPSDIEDAARVGGLPEWKIFLHIVLPLAKPGLATAAIFVFVFSWNEFLFALTFMQQESMYTISVGLTTFLGQRGTADFNKLMAISSLATIPVLVLFALTQEKFIKGITTDF